MKIANYYQVLDNGDIVCTLCPTQCILHKDCVGACKVRKRVNDKLYSLSYGKGIGFCIDPIEKKPLFHFYPGSPIFSFGTYGCNLQCKFCQNDHLSNPLNIPDTEFIEPKLIIDTLIANNVEFLAFTYNEPNVFIEYLIETAKLAKENNIKTIAVTNGYINKGPREDLYKYIDAVNVDLKSFDDSFYKNLCSANLYPILDTIKYIANTKNIWLELTNLVIPSFNDNLETIKTMIDWILNNLGQNVPLHFSSFFPAYKMKNIEPTSYSTLEAIHNIAKDMGINYVYVGNVRNNIYQNTYCKKCGNVLIKRDSYIILENNIKIKDNSCPNCNTVCDGYF